MLKIGVFAGLAQVSIKCLRHYDDIGLLRPVEVDRQSGYRYYTVDQLPRLHRILALKELGFSLEEIARFVDRPLTNEQMREMLRNRQSDLERRVREEQERLERVEAHLQMIESSRTVTNCDVMIKMVGPQFVASMQGVFGAHAMLLNPVSRMFDETRAYVKAQDMTCTGPEFFLRHDGPEEGSLRGETAFPLSAAVSSSRRVQVYELPGALMASAMFKGPLDNAWHACLANEQWMDANGYQRAGAVRHVYHRCDKTGGDSVVEVQFPIVKIAAKKRRNGKTHISKS